MSILTRYLDKLGVTSFTQLSTEEQKTYREWENALEGRQITDTEVRTFLESDLEASITKLTKTLTGDRDDIFLKMKVEFIRTLITFLDSPKREREAVERIISNQL